MAMSKERQGEIALLHLKSKVRRSGVSVGENTVRQVHSSAKEIGISPEEAMEFFEILARELFEETFHKTKK